MLVVRQQIREYCPAPVGGDRDDAMDAKWVRDNFQQFGGASRDRQFGFQLGDSPASGYEVGVLTQGHAWLLPSVKKMLCPPLVYRLLRDLQFSGDLSDRATDG